ncbi:MAG: cupredoxin domain-containing protein [Burkholderiales bacterium]|nr:cupredoxin domain-containing protein [Burkholderiales bacterium]
MTKHLFIVFYSVIALSSYAYAQENTDHSKHQNMEHDDHSGHDMGQHDHSDHDMAHHDHSGHDHSSDDHKGMDHGHDHEMGMHSEHDTMHHDDDHSDHGDHDHHHHHDGHIMDHEGTHIMGQNFDKLPSSCTSISEEIEITVRASTKYAKKFPGTTFAFDQQEWRVKPCSKITWHFINEDNIRHQFMMHGLPRYLYHLGMFHLENTGPRKVSGTMIVPAADETYLVHCDIAQHMEKGMKAQLVVGKGGEDIPSIPGLTPYTLNDKYEVEDLPTVVEKDDKGREKEPLTKQITDFFNDNVPISGMTLIGLLFGIICAPLFARMIALRKKDESETA